MAPTIGRLALNNGFHGSIPGDLVALPPQNIHSRTPSYKSIKNLLAAMKEDSDPVSQNPDSISSETQSQARGITRGARYYGGKRS